MTNFQTAIKFVLQWEGGYANDSVDPGGETNYGISKRSYPDLDIKNLSIADAIEIYKRDYWDLHNLDSEESPMCIALLDAYVQHGASNVDIMRKVADGNWQAFIGLRRNYYLKLIQKNPALQKFQRGWMNRMNDLSKYCEISTQE